ncbi:MAG: type I-E CRISPR-associated protein Cas5/CasD [Pyramidobacter sp.]|jgi:CRISPR system Cascade subunit CasD
MDALILRLRGPLMAFGDVAVDEIRPTDVLPGLSAVTGLIANALGWTFQDVQKLQRLQDRLQIASREDRGGTPLRDYQTARLNSKDLLWRSDGACAERTGGAQGDFTVIRYRYFRADAAVTLLVALEPPEESPTLEEIRRALQRPARPLFIGRVSCPPSQPICQEPGGCEIIHADSLKKALLNVGLCPSPIQGQRKHGTQNSFVAEWPLTPTQAMSVSDDDRVHVIERCDGRNWIANTHGSRRYAWRDIMALPVAEAHDRKEL